MLLVLLAMVTAVLLALGGTAACLPQARRTAVVGTCIACPIAILLAAIALALGAPPVLLVLPVGLPGAGMTLALDGLSAWFLVPVLLAGSAAGLAALDEPPSVATALLPLFIAAMVLTLLGGDAFSLVLGFALISLACWGLLLAGADEDAASLTIGVAGTATICLTISLGLMAPRSATGVIDLGFAAIRSVPPTGLRASGAVVVLLLGFGGAAGLVPAHQAAPAPVAVLISGAMTTVALYVLARVLFDLAGTAPPLWWGLLLLAIGVGAAVFGALKSNFAADLDSVLAWSTIANSGLVGSGLGVALAARAADLTPLAALALSAALFQVLAHGLFKPLLLLAGGAVQRGAATRRLSRLGGLAHRMPVTTGCVLVGAAGLASLPPGPGFPGVWLLLQSVLAAPRIGGLAVQAGFATAMAALALAVALGAASAMRLVGIAFLGRPRTPRTAAAEEAGVLPRATMLALAGLAVLAGLLPGPLLGLAGPALHQALMVNPSDRTGAFAIAAQPDNPGYAAPAIALLLIAIAVALTLALRRVAPAGSRRIPAWDGGFAASPPWLPFGDPLTQSSAAGFSDILRGSLATGFLPALCRLASRLANKFGALADAVLTMNLRSGLVVLFAIQMLLLVVAATQ